MSHPRLVAALVFGACLWCAWSACGPELVCGPGTIEQQGACVPAPDASAEKDTPESAREPTAERAAPDRRPQPDVAPPRDDRPETTDQRPPELRREALPEGATARTGEACGPARKCLVGPCLREGYCTALCDKDEACPAGMQCREINHQQPDGTYKTFLGCVRPPDTPKACAKDLDCPSHQRCTTRVSADGSKVEQRCQDAIPGGKAVGEACDSTKGIRCSNDICLSDAFCSALCAEASDCPKDWACDDVTLTLPNGKAAKIKACTPGKKVCGRDGDCPPGTVCRSFISKDQTKLDFYCSPRSANGAKAGAACDKSAASSSCYNFMCVDAGFCLATCQTAADCPQGFACRGVDATLPKGKFQFKGCVVDQTPCERNADCKGDLVCALASNAAQDKITPVCSLRRLHTQPHGGPCKAGTSSPKNECSNHMCINDEYCSAICKDDADCLKGYRCANLTVPLPNNPNAPVQGCIKE